MSRSIGGACNKVTGRFISFEGPEGGGKSVQVKRLAQRLHEAGIEVVVTREPGGTPLGDQVRTILLGLGDYAILPKTEVLLLAAGRAQHVHEVIQPALHRGAWVICDRFVDSTYAYQGGGSELDLESLMAIQAYATEGLEPDLRILLDLPVETGLARRHAEPDSVNRIDLASLEFHQRVRAMYLHLARTTPEAWGIVNAEQSMDAVSADVWNHIQSLIAES